MQEINEENIDELVNAATDPDTLKELILYAVAQNREDLIEAILDKSIKNNRLIDKLQEFEHQPILVSFLGENMDEQESEMTHSPFELPPESESMASPPEATDPL